MLNKGPLKDGFDRPDGVLLFLGPTGVGKTELAKAVAEFLFGDDKKMIRVDMSEYQDGSVAVDKLIGMPRGIVGSERGGILTNQLKDNPYTVVLLDEVEKASSEPAEPVPAGVRRGLADRRTRQARLPERRRRDHDVEPRLGELPEADEPARVPVAERRHRAGAGRSDARARAPLLAGVPEPDRRGRPLRAADWPTKCARSRSTIWRRWSWRWQRPARRMRVTDEALELIVTQGYSLAFGARFLKRSHRRADQAADQRTLEGGLALRGRASGGCDQRRTGGCRLPSADAALAYGDVA